MSRLYVVEKNRDTISQTENILDSTEKNTSKISYKYNRMVNDYYGRREKPKIEPDNELKIFFTYYTRN